VQPLVGTSTAKVVTRLCIPGRSEPGVGTRWSDAQLMRNSAFSLGERDDSIDKICHRWQDRPSPPENPPPMTHAELAWEFAELFEELSIDRVNDMLAKNVPLETLEFFASYAESFAKSEKVEGPLAKRLPNLLLVGYLLRILEDRLLDAPPGEEPESC
jgi:hypothetical protein